MTDRQRLRQWRPPGQLVRAQVARSVEQGQRVAPGLGHEPLGHPDVDRLAGPGRQELAGVGSGQAAQPDLGQLRQSHLRRRLLSRDDHGDGVGQEAAHHEAEDVRRLVVEPLCIVDHAQQGPALRRLRQQGEDGEAHQERVGRRAAELSERDLQCSPLWIGQPIGRRKQGEEQLVHAGEGQRPLRLDGHHADDLHVGCGVDDLLEEGGLAGTRVAPDDQRAADPGPHAVQQLVERLLLCAVTDQSHGPDRRTRRRAPGRSWSRFPRRPGGLGFSWMSAVAGLPSVASSAVLDTSGRGRETERRQRRTECSEMCGGRLMRSGA